MMELIIALEPVWVDEHKEDALRPMVALTHYMRRITGVFVKPEGDYSCKVTLETQLITESAFRERIMRYMQKRYPDTEMSDRIRIEPKQTSPAIDLDTLFDDDTFDLDEEPELPPDPMEKIRALVGGEEFKELAEECVRVAPLLIKHNILDTFTRQCYLFAINDGEGLSTYLELFGELLSYHKLLGYASKMDMVEKTKATILVAKGFAPTSKFSRLLPVDKKPPAKAIIDKFAPNTAALDTPKVEGDAIGLLSIVCIIRPATARPAPATIAASTRGIRIFQIIRFCALVPCPNTARITSPTVILDDPTNRHTTESITTAAAIARRISRFFRCLFCVSIRLFIRYILPPL